MTTSYIRDLHLAGPGSQPGDQDGGGEDEGLAHGLAAALDAADEGLEPLSAQDRCAAARDAGAGEALSCQLRGPAIEGKRVIHTHTQVQV